jgi:hypothetical protein
MPVGRQKSSGFFSSSLPWKPLALIRLTLPPATDITSTTAFRLLKTPRFYSQVRHPGWVELPEARAMTARRATVLAASETAVATLCIINGTKPLSFGKPQTAFLIIARKQRRNYLSLNCRGAPARDACANPQSDGLPAGRRSHDGVARANGL